MARSRSPRLRSERGASTVEVAVSMVLLIPTALYSIYVGEAFLAGTRAQEAEIAASWDITGYRLHDFLTGQDFEAGPDGDPSFYQDATRAVGDRIEREMARLDSYTGTGGGGQRLVISRQTLASVRCRPMDARPVYGGALLTFQGLPYGSREFLHRGGYVVCQARVNFDPQGMPRDMRDGYTGKVNLLSDALRNGFSVCGSGDSLWGCGDGDRAVPGVVLLTNDWGLEDGTRNRIGQTDNQKYFNVGNKVYRAKREGDDSDLAGGIGTQQIREALLLLLDDPKDYGDTSTFKFGFYNPMGTLHRYPSNDHVGRDDAHLSPWDDGEGPYTSDRHVHENARSQHYYLGHTDSRFLDSPP